MTRNATLKPQPMSPPYHEADYYDTAEAIQASNPNWLVVWGISGAYPADATVQPAVSLVCKRRISLIIFNHSLGCSALHVPHLAELRRVVGASWRG